MNIGLIEKGFRFLSPLIGIIIMLGFANLMYKPKLIMKMGLDINESLTCILSAIVVVMSMWGGYYILRGLILRG